MRGTYNLSSFELKKGKIGDLTLVLWNIADPCYAYPDDEETRNCSLSQACPYPKEGKCGLQAQYMKYLFDSLIKESEESLSQIQLHKIGFFLFPLYQHLIKFKMEAHGITNVTIETKGGKTVHPIFREIRETMKTIEAFYKSIGISYMELTPPDPQDLITDDYMFQHGDPYYYEREVMGNENPESSSDNSKGTKKTRKRIR